MTMRPATRERILKEAAYRPMDLLRLSHLTNEEIRQAAGSQTMDECRDHAFSTRLCDLAERLQHLAARIKQAEDYWIEKNS